MLSNRREFLRTSAFVSAILAARPQLLLASATPGHSPIRFWDMNWGPSGYTSSANSLVHQFNQSNPGMRVTYEHFEWSSWPGNFSDAIASRSAPDLSTGGGYQPMQEYDQGAILAIDDVIAGLKQSGEDKDFLPGTLERAMYKGHAVALPWAMDIRIPIYRKDLFTAANVNEPGTWDELRSAAKVLTVNGQYGFVFAGKEIDGMHALIALMINNGGGLFTPDAELNLMNPRNVEACELIRALVKDGSMNPGSSNFSGADAHKEFLAGRGVMMIDAMGLERQFPDQKDKIGLLAPLTAPHGDKGTILFLNSIMVFKQSKNPHVAKAFLKWWSANEKPLWIEGKCDQLPVRRSIASDPYFQSDPTTKRILEEWVPVGKGTGAQAHAVFPALNEVEGNGSIMSLLQDLLRGQEVMPSLRTCEAALSKVV